MPPLGQHRLRFVARGLFNEAADAVDAAWPQLKPTEDFAPRIRSEQVTLKRRSFTEAQIAKAKDMAASMVTKSFGTVPMAETVCILETLDKKDQPLFKLLPVVYAARLRADQAELQTADIRLRNTERLFQENVVSDQEVALAKAELERAKAKVE